MKKVTKVIMLACVLSMVGGTSGSYFVSQSLAQETPEKPEEEEPETVPGKCDYTLSECDLGEGKKGLQCLRNPGDCLFHATCG